MFEVIIVSIISIGIAALGILGLILEDMKKQKMGMQ